MTDDEAKAAAAEPAAEAASPKPKKRLGKGAKIGLGVLGAIVLVVAVLLIWILSPAKPETYDEPVSFETREQNTALYGAVIALWIDIPYVEVTPERAYVAYDWEASRANASWVALQTNASSTDPAVLNDTVTRDDLQRMIIGSAAEVLEGVTTLEIAQFDHTDAKVTWTVSMADVESYFAGEITLADFEARITKS